MQFEVDESRSLVVDEHMLLAEYLHTRYLTVDVYDADSRFIYATCKIPLFELMRQQTPHLERAKEVELSSPEGRDFRGSIQLIMGNEGRTQHIEKKDLVQQYEKYGRKGN